MPGATGSRFQCERRGAFAGTDADHIPAGVATSIGVNARKTVRSSRGFKALRVGEATPGSLLPEWSSRGHD